jgi:hypothetical protein
MKIDIRSRDGKRPLYFTHAVFVEDVPVGFGDMRQCEIAAESLYSDPQTAMQFREEFLSEPEEW